MKTALAALIVGYGLDLLLGDPSFLYHPIRVIGNLIALLEKWLRKVFPKTPKGELAGGVFLVILVCLAGYGGSGELEHAGESGEGALRGLRRFRHRARN